MKLKNNLLKTLPFILVAMLGMAALNPVDSYRTGLYTDLKTRSSNNANIAVLFADTGFSYVSGYLRGRAEAFNEAASTVGAGLSIAQADVSTEVMPDNMNLSY